MQEHPAEIVCTIDHKGRKRINVEPDRDNANINTCISPVIQLALRGNHDCKYLSSTHGAVEYCCKYCSKMEAPDSKLVRRLSLFLLFLYDCLFFF